MRLRPLIGTGVAVLAAVAALATVRCAPRRGDPPGVSDVPPATAPSTAAATAAHSSTLTVTVTGIRSRKGQLIFGVFRSAAGFPKDASKAAAWQVRDVDGESMTFTAALPPGVYAASVLHDENRSGDMDLGFAGIPKEGYGVTNNPKPVFRAAMFQEATFTLPPEGAEMTISVQYF